MFVQSLVEQVTCQQSFFVDNNDLLHVDMGKDQSAEDAAYDLKHSIDNWGQLLMASGGLHKPEKCFFLPDIIYVKGRWEMAVRLK